MIGIQLAKEAATRDVDVCVSESRAANGGVTGTRQKIGQKYAGRLQQHILINGPKDVAENEEDSPFEDFNCWYFDKRDLRRISSAFDEFHPLATN